MVHAIEAFTSKRLKNPLSDMLALQSLGLLSRNIRAAVLNGKDVAAREAMLLGAMLAGQAFANAPVAAVHALAYPLGGNYHIPHGLSNSLVLPHVLRFNSASAPDLYRVLAETILPDSAVTESAGGAAEALADYFLELAEEFGLQTSLRQMDIPEHDLSQLAEEAMLQQRLLINNPRDVSYDDALRIYQQAY
jgi:alcohol dehydrogenase